jgi:inner membrane protein
MDNLTHALTGVVLARAGLDRWTPRATAISVVAANLPDIDIVTAGSAINYLTYHRHITHSLAATPLMAALAVLLVEGFSRIGRRRAEAIRWGPAFGVALIATLSHHALDMTNAYGMRLWLPFDDSWSSWDVLFVIDPWVWAILLAAILTPLALVFVLRGGVTRVGWAWAGLAVLSSYIGARAVLHDRAIQTIASLTNELAVTRVAVFPLPLEVFRWSGLVETNQEFRSFIIDTRTRQPVGPPHRFPKTADSEVLRKARATPLAREYLRFAQYAQVEVAARDGGYEVQFSDFRFRRGETSGFLCTVDLDSDLNLTNQDFRYWGGEGILSFARRVLGAQRQ